MRVWRQLHDDKAPKEVAWDVEEDEGPKHLSLAEKIFGTDQKKRLTHVVRTKVDEELIVNKKKYTLQDTFTGQVIEMSKATHRKELQNDTVYPVMIDADINIFPTASADDGGAMKVNNTCSFIFNNTTSVTIEYITRSGTYKRWNSAYFRFSGLSIPRLTSITSAKLRLYPANFSGPIGVKIKAKNQNDPANPTLCAQVITPGTLASHTAQKTITAAGAYAETTITTIVQELVNAYSYANQHMLFFASRSLIGGTTSHINVYTQDAAGTTKDPNLVISYPSATANALFFGTNF